MFNISKHHDKWYRMDNSAFIYPISITTTTQSLFRLTAEMDTDVDEDALTVALNKVLERFPSFKVQLRSGFFKHFFDHNDNEAKVHPDNGVLFQKINFLENNHYLIRVSYFKTKLMVDYFHALCDGNGAIEFLKALVYSYLCELSINPENDGSVKTISDNPDYESELEDSFIKHSGKFKLFNGVISKMSGKTSYQIRGKKFPNVGYGLIQAYIDTEQLKALSKKYNCSITALIVANALLSVCENSKKATSNKNLVAMVPVDLRKHFKSSTLLNFTSLVRCKIDMDKTKKTLSDYCSAIDKQLKTEVNPKDLYAKLNLSSFFGRMWLLKIMPLFIKSFFIKLVKKLNIRTNQTMIISNLGIVKMPLGTEQYLKHLAFSANVSSKAPKNMGIVTFNNVTTISFTRKVISTEIEKSFFSRFANEGVAIKIVSNFRECEHM